MAEHLAHDANILEVRVKVGAGVRTSRTTPTFLRDSTPPGAASTAAWSGGTSRLMLGTKPTTLASSSNEAYDLVARASFIELAISSTWAEGEGGGGGEGERRG